MADRHAPEGVSSEPLGNGREEGRDDHVVAFQTERAGAMGRVVRLGACVDEILRKHAYPEPVARVLGEALALTAMLGTTLKMGGRLILQTTTDGPLNLMVVNFDAPGSLRGYARFDDAVDFSSGERVLAGKLLGKGHMAMTVDPGGELDRYQGIVALDDGSLSTAALTYFHSSEQLPTYLRLAVARQFISADSATGLRDDTGSETDARSGSWHWRAGGLLVQHVAREGGVVRDMDGGDGGDGDSQDYGGDLEDLEDWNRTRLLAATVEDHELLDPTLASERLLFRLFHEEGVRVTGGHKVGASCRCSRERVEAFVRNFSAEEMASLREDDGGITVTCEFCNAAYRFQPGEV